MHYTQAIAAVAALSCLASAAPSKRSTFSVQQAATGKMIKRSGPAAYKKALAKFGAPIPNAVNDAVAAVQSGSVSASPSQFDSEYLSPITVGGQTLMMDFDTGSSDLWVFSTLMPKSDTTGQTEYNPNISGTRKTGFTYDISFGDGSGSSGVVFADTVEIGGVTATGQAVEAATSVSATFTSNTADDGLVGFAFSSINTVQPTKQLTWFDNVKSSLPSPLFAVTLKHDTPGTYDFGFIDNAKFTGSITFTPVDNSQGFWQFTADGFVVGGTQHTSSLVAIADTGTSLILMADAVVTAYYSQVSGSKNSAADGGFIFPCTATLPDFSVIIGGASLLVPGDFMNFAPNGDGTCFGGIQSSAGIGFNILGDVFLKNQYVVFDSGNTRLGFAPQAGGATNASTAALLYTPRWAQK